MRVLAQRRCAPGPAAAIRRAVFAAFAGGEHKARGQRPLCAAFAAEAARFKRAQQGLPQLGRQRPGACNQQCAAAGPAQRARMRLGQGGIKTPRTAQQRAAQQRGGHGGAIQHGQRMAAARALPVDGPGYLLRIAPRRPRNPHGQIVPRRRLHPRPQPPRRRAGPYNAIRRRPGLCRPGLCIESAAHCFSPGALSPHPGESY